MNFIQNMQCGAQMRHGSLKGQCTILDQISSVAEGLSLVKMRESCPT